MAENFPKLMTVTKPQTQESQRTPSKINTAKSKLNYRKSQKKRKS